VRIGIDFDNTIACYDGVFYAAGVERGLIPPDVATDKTSVRDHLRAEGRDADFTELQGYVYGPGMKHVSLYPGLLDFLERAARAGHHLHIVSHKTKTPFAGPPYDLHEAARGFLSVQKLVHADTGLFEPESVFFELTKEAKVARVAALGCDVFIDDLPEILAMDGYPPGLRAILFDPEGHYGDGTWNDRAFERHGSWASIAAALLGPGP
jgi:hypothetical protein